MYLVAKKTTSTPWNLKSKVDWPRKGRWEQEYYLLMCRKMESQRFMGVLGEKYREKREKSAQKGCLKSSNFVLVKFTQVWGCLGQFIGKNMFDVHLVHARWRQQLCLFQLFGSNFDRLWRPFQTLIEVILMALEIFGCLVSRILDISKIQWLDQKLCPWEVSWCAQNSFQDISTVLTQILTHE